MDYTHWAITTEDSNDCLAPRHGGRANVLFADGRVEALYPEEITDGATQRIRAGMLTPQAGD